MATRERRADAAKLRHGLRVEPASRVSLADHDPRATHGWQRADADRQTARQLEQLAELQERLWAEDRRAVLVVLQGIDASGKDGTIRRVLTAFNPQGSPVSSFKVPTPEELAHDFLWRTTAACRARARSASSTAPTTRTS
ncbi:hypothetical protein BH23CHL7_BH23CHL7_12150 [soil metagenome]